MSQELNVNSKKKTFVIFLVISIACFVWANSKIGIGTTSLTDVNSVCIEKGKEQLPSSLPNEKVVIGKDVTNTERYKKNNTDKQGAESKIAHKKEDIVNDIYRQKDIQQKNVSNDDVSKDIKVASTNPKLIFITLVIGSFLLLSAILETPFSLSAKGFLLVAVGAGIIAYFDEVIDLTTSYNMVSLEFEMVKNIIIVGFAGAGGGLLSEHAKKSASDADKNIVIFNKTQRIKYLEREVEKANTKVNYVLGVLIVLCIIGVALIITR